MKSQRTTRMSVRQDDEIEQTEMEILLELMEEYFNMLESIDFSTVTPNSPILVLGDEFTLNLPLEALHALRDFAVVRKGVDIIVFII